MDRANAIATVVMLVIVAALGLWAVRASRSTGGRNPQGGGHVPDTDGENDPRQE